MRCKVATACDADTNVGSFISLSLLNFVFHVYIHACIYLGGKVCVQLATAYSVEKK